jgi:hypothetical protein
MKTTGPSENDESLRKALRAWRVTTPLPPRFQEQVWRRIERTATQCDDSVWTMFVNRLAEAMARPVPALAYVTALLMISLTIGYWQARERTAQWDKDFAQRYLQAVDPYQKSSRN